MQNPQHELANPPTDGITGISFKPTDSNFLLASSWDKTVRFYNVNENKMMTKFEHNGPVLDACFGPGDHIFSGSLDKQVRMLDLGNESESILGEHANVRCVNYASETDRVYTGSWDKSIHVWDARSPGAVEKHELSHKVFSMDVLGNKLAIALSNRQVYIYDIRNMGAPWQEREKSLHYMLRSIRLMPNGEGYACSSIEGRIALEFFDMSPEVQSRKYAFKSHRQVINDTEVVYPVNALAFHPIYGTFASGGSDCIVNVWDGVNRKRIRQFPRFPESIANLAFSHDGRTLAVASSYTFDEGDRDHGPDAIFIRTLADSDCKPRSVPASTTATQ